MGITGLIPFLEKASRPIHVSQFSGCTVAIDSYCWLHKGAFSCADKLARGDACYAYIHYCMKYINTLLAHNIKPIMVFDGRHLPAKADTEKKRREAREVNRRRAAELMRQDKPDQARTYLRRCIDITHDMALALMKECRARNIDCITAPYEADAQLAYLNIHNIAHIVITEDSDLLLFGCTKVLFKMDINGGGLLVEQDKLHLAMDIRPSNFTMDKFRYMCILSGCDYLPSLPGIGLTKACRFIKRTADTDIHRALSRLGSHLNMNLVVPLEYRDNFLVADAMFRHQPAFDPITRQIVPLTPLPPGAPPLLLPEKDKLSPEKALQLAYGNLDPFTMEVVDDWDPDKPQPKPGKTNNWSAIARAPHKSIWSADFKPKMILFETPEPPPVKHSSTAGKEKEQTLDILPTLKRPPPPSNETMLASLREQFCCETPSPSKKPCLDITNTTVLHDPPDITDIDELLETLPDTKHHNPFCKKTKPCLDITNRTPVNINSPQLDDPPDITNIDQLLESSPDAKHHHNPFFKKNTPTQKTLPSSESKFSALSKFSRLRKTEVNDNCVVQSRYFGSSVQETVPKHNDLPNSNTLFKEIQNITSSSKKKSNTTQQLENFTKNSPVKHNLGKFRGDNKSPVKRKSLFTSLIETNELNKSESNENDVLDKEKKENLVDKTNTNSINNNASTFKWSRSLEDRFSFKSSQVVSSKAVSKGFRNPVKDCLVEIKSEPSFDTKEETKQKVRNPFKVNDVKSKFKYSLGSQGSSSCEEDSFEDSQTGNTIDSPFQTSKAKQCVNSLMSPPTPLQCRRPGLSKKTTPGVGRQQSLLNMFGFKQKSKVQR